MSRKYTCGICLCEHERSGGYCRTCYNAYQRWRKREGRNVIDNPMSEFRRHASLQVAAGLTVDDASPRKKRPHVLGCLCAGCMPFEAKRILPKEDEYLAVLEADSQAQWHPDPEDPNSLIQHPNPCGCYLCNNEAQPPAYDS